jgi:putative protease
LCKEDNGLSEKELTEVGKITHFFTKISVAIVELTDTLVVGDQVLIKGPTTSVEQKVESMQIEHETVEEAKRGQSVGLKVNAPVREHDVVYKVKE